MSLQQFVNYRKMGGILRVFQLLTILSLVISVVGFLFTMFIALFSIGTGILTPTYLIYSIVNTIISVVFGVIQLVMLTQRNKKLSLYHTIFSVIEIAIVGVSFFIPMVGSIPLAALNLLFLLGTTIAFLIYFERSQRYRVYSLTTQEFNDEYNMRRLQWEQQMA